MKIISDYIRQISMGGGGNPLDIIWCTLRYGASPNNYREFGFKNLTASQRSTYVTNRFSRQMIKRLNAPAYIDLFEDKTKFADRFAAFFGREWISTQGLTLESFKDFLRKADNRFVMKPIDGAQGNGISVYMSVDNADTLFTEIQAKGQNAILEQWIHQHPVLNRVYPNAVNCLRIITAYIDGQIYYLAGGMTWGNGKQLANACASGIVSPVNFETGILEKPAADFEGHVFEKHPITGEDVVGIQLPFWKETKEMLEKAVRVVPQVGYIGWDIAITPEGPILIEGNTTPGYKYYQIPVHMTEKTGNKQKYLSAYQKSTHSCIG